MSQRTMPVAAGKLYGDLNANGNKVTGLADAVNDGDAVSKKYLEEHGGAASVTDVQVDGTSVVSQGVANITGKQDVISDLATIRAGAALGATSIQAHQDISGKADATALTAEVTRATAAEDALSTALAGKQGTIADLSTIRSNATLARPKLDMNVYQIGQRPKWTFTCEGDVYLAEMLGLQDPTIDEQNGILTFRDKPDPFRESGGYGVWSIREYGTMSGGFNAELVESSGEVEVGTTTSLMPIKTMVPDPSNPEVVSGDAVAKKSDFTLTQGQLPAGGYAAQLFSNNNGLLMGVVRYGISAKSGASITFDDRKINTVDMTAGGTFALTPPTQTSGFARDFIVRLVCGSTAPTVDWTAFGTPEVKSGDSWSDMSVPAANKSYIYRFTDCGGSALMAAREEIG